MAMFPCPRRIVTGHDEDGTAVVLQDGPIASVPIMRGVHFTVLWETNEVPASNDGSEDPIAKKTTDLVNKNGVILRVVDLPAHTEKKDMLFHRTESLDYGILFQGEAICHLDNDVQIHMKPGDVCIQRGTVHGWTNPSDKPARIYFSLVAAKPVTVNNVILGSNGYSKVDMETGGSH